MPLPELKVSAEDDAKLRAAINVVKSHGAKRAQLRIKDDGQESEIWELRLVVKRVQ